MMDKIARTAAPAAKALSGNPAQAGPDSVRGGAQGSAKAGKAGEAPKGDEFAGQMQAQAALMAMAGQQQVPAQPAMTAPNAQLAASAETAQTAAQAQTQAGARATSPLQKQLEVRQAASLNTGATIAGLQPWSREWVFEGADKNPNLKGLLSSETAPQAANASAALSQLMEAEKLAEGVAAEQAGQKISNGETGLGPVTRAIDIDLLKTRGDVAGRGAGLTPDLSQLNAAALSGQQAGIAGVSERQASQLGNAMDEKAALENGSSSGAALSDMLSKLDGQLDTAERPGAQRSGGNQALSGAEFLSTLTAVKGGAQAKTGSDAGSFGQQSGKQGLRLESQENLLGKKSGRILDGEPSFESASAAAGLTAGHSVIGGTRVDSVAVKPAEVQAHVVQGGMAQDRLSTDGLVGIGASIRNLSSHGGGEIRVRLRPENLGELHLRVVTDGKQVGLQIQASDDQARKILEHSLNDLKEGLAGHQLSLGKVEFSVGQTASSAFSGSSDQQPQAQNPFSGSHNMAGGNQGDRSGQWAGEGASTREGWNAAPLRMAGNRGMSAISGASTAQAAGSRRLDVKA